MTSTNNSVYDLNIRHCDNNAFFVDIMSILMGIKALLKGHTIKRTSHFWSFHMTFIKLTEGSFDKSHMK